MKRRAFTLIELLVVIGIIVLLIAIVIPSLTSARKFARSACCSSNMKQLSLSLTNYDLNNGHFPNSFVEAAGMSAPSGGFLGNFRYDNIGLWWINFITDKSRGDLDDSSVFLCPSRKLKGDRFKDNILLGNYGVNQSICKSRLAGKQPNEFMGVPLSETDMRFPSQTLLVADAGYAIINWHHVTDSPPVPLTKNHIEDCSYIPGLSINRNRTFWDDQEEDAIYGRHLNNSVNIGFGDGHAGTKKADDLLIKKTSESYENKKPIWVPQRK